MPADISKIKSCMRETMIRNQRKVKENIVSKIVSVLQMYAAKDIIAFTRYLRQRKGAPGGDGEDGGGGLLRISLMNAWRD
jgi:hypothetical protein